MASAARREPGAADAGDLGIQIGHREADMVEADLVQSVGQHERHVVRLDAGIPM